MNRYSPGPRNNTGTGRDRSLPIIVVLMSAVMVFLMLPLASSAYSLHVSPQQARQPASNSVTIAPGGTATFTARGFCLDFGKPFPDQAMTTNSLADGKVRAALNYSLQKGYTEGSPDQVELAIWFLRDNTWHNAQHTTAQEIVTNATTASPPPATGDGTPLSDAITQNKVTITAKFVAQTAGHFYGDATIELKNPGTSQIQVFVPVGTVFTVPGAAGKYQDLATYVLRVQSQAPTAQPTSTPQPTQQPTQQPAATQAPQPTATTDPSLLAQAQPTPSPGTLPQTGYRTGGDGSGGPVIYILLALGLVLCGGLLSYRSTRGTIR